MRYTQRDQIRNSSLFSLLLILLMASFTQQAVATEAVDNFDFNDRGTHYNRLEYVETIQTAPGAYTLRFQNEEEYYYTNFLVTSEGVIAFDPLSDSAAKAYVKVIREKAPGAPLRAIVYSHLHTDHVAGARILRKAFGADVPIIAHQRTKRFFEIRKVPFVDLPTETVGDEGKVYRFGDRTLELKYLGDAHTASILVAVVPELKQAYTVDFINGDVVGWTTLPGINLDELMAMQRRVLELDAEIFTFGHGLPGDRETIKLQIQYYEDLKQAVSNAIQQGHSENQAVQSIELPQYRHFWNYDDWFKQNIRGMYRWLNTKQN